jgi:hypothetical protein
LPLLRPQRRLQALVPVAFAPRVPDQWAPQPKKDGETKPLDIARPLVIESEVFGPPDPTSNFYAIY